MGNTFNIVGQKADKLTKRKREYCSTEFSKYKVTGVSRNMDVLRAIVTTNYLYADSIERFRGSLWGFHIEENRWIKLKEMYTYQL